MLLEMELSNQSHCHRRLQRPNQISIPHLTLTNSLLIRKTRQVCRKLIVNFPTEEVLRVVEEQVLFLLPLPIQILHHLRQITVQQGTTLL